MLALREGAYALQPPAGGVRGSGAEIGAFGKIIVGAGIEIGFVNGAEIGGEAEDLEGVIGQRGAQFDDRLEGIIGVVDQRRGEIADAVIDRRHAFILCARVGGVKAMRGKSSRHLNAPWSLMF